MPTLTNKIKTKSNENWEVTAERFVGYIDIMGFKDLVARNTHEKIYKLMQRVSDALKETESFYSTDYNSDGFQISIRMMTYSDSIMIYSRDDSENSMTNFLGAISSLTEDLFLEGIPFKGAVAFGTMTLDFPKSIFFGQPLIDAYLLQEELAFYGVIVHASAEYKRKFRDNDSVLEYPCPFKNGVANHFTILPATLSSDTINNKDYETLLRKVRRLGKNTSGSLRKYIDNTNAFLEKSHFEVLGEIKRIDAED